MMAVFAPGRNLGAVGQAFMEAAYEQSEEVIDADSGEKMEKYLDKAHLQKAIKSGEIRPLTIEHIPYVFAGAEKKK